MAVQFALIELPRDRAAAAATDVVEEALAAAAVAAMVVAVAVVAGPAIAAEEDGASSKDTAATPATHRVADLHLVTEEGKEAMAAKADTADLRQTNSNPAEAGGDGRKDLTRWSMAGIGRIGKFVNNDNPESKDVCHAELHWGDPNLCVLGQSEPNIEPGERSELSQNIA